MMSVKVTEILVHTCIHLVSMGTKFALLDNNANITL